MLGKHITQYTVDTLCFARKCGLHYKNNYPKYPTGKSAQIDFLWYHINQCNNWHIKAITVSIVYNEQTINPTY